MVRIMDLRHLPEVDHPLIKFQRLERRILEVVDDVASGSETRDVEQLTCCCAHLL